VLERFVLPALGPTALALLARVDRGWLAVVVWSSGLLRAGLTEEVPLKVKEFCRATHLGQNERVPMGREDVCTCRVGGTYRGAEGRGSMAARGMSGRAGLQLTADTWTC
jgi:hypothetical protein